MEISKIYREGIIINDNNDSTTRITEIYHSNKIYKLVLKEGVCIENTILNDCCVNLIEISDISTKINALKKFENNLKIDNCNKYINENKDNPFANRINYVKKELSSYKKENKTL